MSQLTLAERGPRTSGIGASAFHTNLADRFWVTSLPSVRIERIAVKARSIAPAEDVAPKRWRWARRHIVDGDTGATVRVGDFRTLALGEWLVANWKTRIFLVAAIERAGRVRLAPDDTQH